MALLSRRGRKRYPAARYTAIALAAASVASCSDLTGADGSGARVWVHATRIVLTPGDEAYLHAKFQSDPSARVVRSEDATWHVAGAGAEVLDVSPSGRVRALRPGSATVWVEAGGARDSASLTVRDAARQYTTRWASVSVGNETACALNTAGKAYCWGGDYYGAVGDGSLRRWTNAHAPVAVASGQTFASVQAGMFHACALTRDGVAFCWGDAAVLRGQSGASPVLRPEQVESAPRFTQLASGDYHLCGLDQGGVGYCWGLSAFGELGDGVTGLHRRREPRPLKTPTRFSSIVPGHFRTCALALDRSIFCWGLGSVGRLGNGSPGDRAVPTLVSGGRAYRSLSGRSHACATAVDGSTYCWGPNVWAQIGSGPEFLEEPARLESDKQFPAVLAGEINTCGRRDGATYCWGGDWRGNLGSGSLSEQRCNPVDQFPCSSVPRPVAGGLVFEQLSMSGTVSCGITPEHALYCWGSNDKGQLGNGSLHSQSAVPVRVADPM